MGSMGYCNIKKYDEVIDMKKFTEGMQFRFSMLYGGAVTAKVTKVTDTEITLTESWLAEDTLEMVSEDTVYEKKLDDNGDEYIVIWEYYDHKCTVYGEEQESPTSLAIKGFYVRPLSENDRIQVKNMDQLSGFCVEQWIDAVDFAWGIFKDDNLIGYCTIGIADDADPLVEEHEAYKADSSLLLSDVFILPEYRNHGYGSQMIKESIETRWKMDGEKNTVYLHAMGVTGDLSYDEKLKSFYEKIGFSELCSDREIMVLTVD